jgi:Flp pilus assembly protein TadD
MMRTGDLKGARRLLEDCLTRAPGFARAHMSRGDLARQDGQLGNAELSYLRALAIKPGSASFHLRLADLYLTEGVVHRPGAGAIHLSRALELKPEWIRLHLRLARVYQVMGKIQEARQHVDQFLASDSGEELKSQAGVLKRSLAGDRPEEAASKGEGTLEGVEISTLVRKLNHARVLLSRGQPDAAMAQLRSLENHDSNILILNLEARILHAAGRTEAARECLTNSLGIQPEQPELLELLGQWSLLEGEPEVGRAYLLRAELKGSTHASFHLARLALGQRGSGLGLIFSDLRNIQALLGARARLVGYLEQSPESIYLEEATGYLTDVRGRIRNLVLMALSLLLLVLAFVIGWRRKVWGGVGVVELLDQFPETGPEVQRILSAIRHEVLKHNTMVLNGLIDAIEQGAPFAEKGAALQTSLFGEDMASGVAQKLRDYCSELEGIGRANRLRLNLRHRDRVIAPLIVGMVHLRACSTLMLRGENLGSRGRKTLLRSLKRAHRLLNVEGYEGIMGLIDVLRTLRVDRAYLTGVYVRTLREPGLKRAQLADLQWLESIELPAWALIPRHAMDDILTNIVRNAVQSSMYHDESLVEIGLRVESDLDVVTGIERISVLVLDQSPQVLTTEMLRGRYIADGLGLTADLVSQYQGSLDVVEVEGWQKAVRVRVPRIYPEERED